MNIEVIEQPEQELIDYLGNKIKEFNMANWELKERLPLAMQLKSETGEVIAGATARTFGNWLLLDYLWVSEQLRGQNVGSQILEKLETAAKQRGCDRCLLDTLDFQAKPFYEKHGYQVQWVQQDYPKTGSKYFMVKQF